MLHPLGLVHVVLGMVGTGEEKARGATGWKAGQDHRGVNSTWQVNQSVRHGDVVYASSLFLTEGYFEKL